MCGEFEIDEVAESRAIASALAQEADIPPASASFSRRCLAAARLGDVKAPPAYGWGGFKFAASLAAIASFATWAATMAVMTARHGEVAQNGGGEQAVEVEEASSEWAVASSSAADQSMPVVSNESVVNADPGATVLWKTLNAGQSQMAWEWPEGVKSAKLTISGIGMTAAKIYNRDDAFPVWNPPVPADFTEEDVYTATLTFFEGERGAGAEVASLVADGIGFVRGVSGVGTHFVSGKLGERRVAAK